MHLGLKIPGDLNEWLRPQRINEEAAIERAMNVVQERRAESLTGALEILGVLQHTPATEEMIDILSDPPNDEVRLAAVIGLGRLGEAASPAVQLIKDQLGQDRCRHAVRDTLFRIGTPEARRALFESLDQHWDANVAVSLSEFQDTRTAAIDELVGRLQTGDGRTPDPWHDDAHIVLSIATDDVLADVMRRCPTLCDRVRETALAFEGGLWFVGSKADAIRALAVLDPHTAKLAATKALTDRSSRDRHLYAALLYRLDPIKARNTFLNLAAEEPNAAVHWTMASALQPSDASWLRERLGASLVDTRLAACKLSRITALTDKDVNERIVRLLEDPSHHARDAAAKVIEHCQHERWTGTLVEQLDQPLIAKSRAWAILDAILAVAEVGYKGTSWPRWAHQFVASQAVRECPALRMVLIKRIEERRKKALEEAERDASRGS
jgi:HEAT repeat protein